MCNICDNNIGVPLDSISLKQLKINHQRESQNLASGMIK